jgi:beta-mannosidase
MKLVLLTIVSVSLGFTGTTCAQGLPAHVPGDADGQNLGGVPLGPPVRDRLIAADGAILKSGPDMGAIRCSTSTTMGSEPVYQLVPVSPRENGQITLDGEWELAEAKDELAPEPASPDPDEWSRVPMPNTIQHALFQAGKTKNPWFGDNYKDLQWIAKTDWYLRKRFTIPEDWKQRQIRLAFDGMDYIGVVWLDGILLGRHEGMFGGPSFDVTRMLKPGEHELLVRLIHETGPQSGPAQVIKSMAVDGTSYQWGNRYRTIGLWRSVRLVSTGGAYLEAPYVQTDRIAPGRASLHAEAMIQNTGEAGEGTISASIIDLQSGKVVWQAKTRQALPPGKSYWEQSMEIGKPRLWWPNGVMEGSHPLYRLRLSLSCNDRENDAIASRFGIRTVEMARNPSWPKAPRANLYTTAAGEPGSPLWEAMRNPDESYRFVFVVNGVPMYAKGGCWLTSDDLLALNPARESWMIRAAKAAGLNLFRLNGGCNIFETEQFYNLCDENGILVWQELPFCWNTNCGSSLSAWREQLTQSVLRIRQHPSLAVYVGGNEFNPYDPGVSPVVNLYREICAGYDNRPFRMSSPGGGTAHAYVPWIIYSADPSWYGTIYNEGYNFVSEWSFVTMANLSLLDRIIPPGELAKKPVGLDWPDFVRDHPLVTDRSCELDFVGHYPFNKGSWYSDLAKADMAEFVEDEQMAQADAYGCVFEQWRSQFPYKGGETVWVYNTMGPSSSWNLIDWFGQPLISYYTTKRADEPIHVMAKTPFRSFGPGETFRASIMTLTDRKTSEKGVITARLLNRDMEPLLVKRWKVSIGAGETNSREMAWDIPSDTPEGYFFLELTLESLNGKRLSRQVYWERVLQALAKPEERKKWQAQPVPEPICKTGPWLRPQIASCQTSLSLEVSPLRAAGPEATVTATVKNTGNKPAYPVILTVSPEHCAVLWSDNYLWLDPGETAGITGTVRLDMRGLDPLSVENKFDPKDVKVAVAAWNAKGRGGSRVEFN